MSTRAWQVWGNTIITAKAVSAQHARNFGTYEAAAEWCRAELAKPAVSMFGTWCRLMITYRHGSTREMAPPDAPLRFRRAGYSSAGGYAAAEVIGEPETDDPKEQTT